MLDWAVVYWLRGRSHGGWNWNCSTIIEIAWNCEFWPGTAIIAIQLLSCHRQYGPLLRRQTSSLRDAICSEKRLWIVLDWLADGSTHNTLARLYDISKAAICDILHEGIRILCSGLVPAQIIFPAGKALAEVATGFGSLCSLPMCVGAVDGALMKITQASLQRGYVFSCCKKYSAIIILVCVDHRGLITHISAGQPGSLGDAATSSLSGLRSNLPSLLAMPPDFPVLEFEGDVISPFIVVDSAFPLTEHPRKCYEAERPTPEQFQE